MNDVAGVARELSRERATDPGMPPEISIIIPCLNEEQNVPMLVDKLSALLEAYALDGEILIVDDCSDDYTFREAYVLSQRHRRVRALHKGLPRGIGRAIRYGIQHARGRLAVVVMGDLVDPLAAIPDFRDKIVDEGNQLVLLSRYLDPTDAAGIPSVYRFYHFAFRWCCKLLVGIRLTDITYAYRAFDLAWARSINLSSDGFEISPEITCKAWLGGARICELRGRQGRRFHGESKFLFSREGFGYASVLLKATACRFTGRWARFSSKRSRPADIEHASR